MYTTSSIVNGREFHTARRGEFTVAQPTHDGKVKIACYDKTRLHILSVPPAEAGTSVNPIIRMTEQEAERIAKGFRGSMTHLEVKVMPVTDAILANAPRMA